MTGQQLKAWREARGLSQVAAAEALGIAARSLAAYEKAAEVPKVVRLAVAGLDTMLKAAV